MKNINCHNYDLDCRLINHLERNGFSFVVTDKTKTWYAFKKFVFKEYFYLQIKLKTKTIYYHDSSGKGLWLDKEMITLICDICEILGW